MSSTLAVMRRGGYSRPGPVLVKNGLFGDHRQIGNSARLILISRDIQRVLGGSYRVGLGACLVLQNTQRGKIVLHLLERGEDRLTVIGHRRIKSGFLLMDLGAAPAGIK